MAELEAETKMFAAKYLEASVALNAKEEELYDMQQVLKSNSLIAHVAMVQVVEEFKKLQVVLR